VSDPIPAGATILGSGLGRDSSLITSGEDKGGWISPLIEYPKEMSQGFWVAIVAFSTTFAVNALLSCLTKRDKSDEELKGLVYSLTPKILKESDSWIMRPAVLGTMVLIVSIILNIIFW
jgi:SSS family solute:Na+ symporter